MDDELEDLVLNNEHMEIEVVVNVRYVGSKLRGPLATTDRATFTVPYDMEDKYYEFPKPTQGTLLRAITQHTRKVRDGRTNKRKAEAEARELQKKIRWESGDKATLSHNGHEVELP